MTYDAEACRGAFYHAPKPTVTDRHHVRPHYLADLLGLPPPTRTVPLCATEHQAIHHILDRHLLSDGTLGGHRLAERTRGYVEDAWLWWRISLLKEP